MDSKTIKNGPYIKRCGECKACKIVEVARGHCLAIANPPFSHADDATVSFWNQTLKENPCETWPKED
jgi:hypothetical protein